MTACLTPMPFADVHRFDKTGSRYKVNKVEINPHWAFPIEQFKSRTVYVCVTVFSTETWWLRSGQKPVGRSGVSDGFFPGSTWQGTKRPGKPLSVNSKSYTHKNKFHKVQHRNPQGFGYIQVTSQCNVLYSVVWKKRNLPLRNLLTTTIIWSKVRLTFDQINSQTASPDQ